MLKLFVSRCMIEAEHRQYTSIAFPAMGSSLLVFPPILVAKVMFKAVEKFGEAKNPQHLKRVDFVLNPLEKEVIEVHIMKIFFSKRQGYRGSYNKDILLQENRL